MTKSNATTSYFRSGLPYTRSGSGHRALVIFEGLGFENKPMSGLMVAGLYRFLKEDYTIYSVTRKPGSSCIREWAILHMENTFARTFSRFSQKTRLALKNRLQSS